MQLLGVGQHGVRLGAKEVGVPNVQQAHEHGHVLGERRVAHVLVHGVEAAEELTEHVRAERDGKRGADRGSDRVAATNPVPEAEGVLWVNSEVGHLV